jgi:hypothetical protein
LAQGTLSPGKFVLQRWNGAYVYPLESAEIFVTRFRDVVELKFLVQAAEDPVELPAGAEHDGVAPRAWVCVLLNQFVRAELPGSHFSVPAAYDEQHHQVLSGFYYVDHEQTWDNVIEVLDAEARSFHVRWSALTNDVDALEGSKPAARLEVDGHFQLRETEVIDQSLRDYNSNPHGGLWLGLLVGGTLGALVAWATAWLAVWVGGFLGGLAGLAWADWIRQRRFKRPIPEVSVRSEE